MSELPTDSQEANIYAAILEDISRGNLAGGQRLKVSELANRFEVSTSPIREVLRRMQGEGFVQIEPNRGAIVSPVDMHAIQNTFEVLKLLEPYFVTWFAEHAQPEMIDALEAIQEQIEATVGGELYRFRQLDTQFHGYICSKHYNQVAADTWRRLRTALNVHTARLRISPTRVQTILKEHRALIQALRENDVEAADRTIRQHVDGSFTQMSQQLRALGL